MNIRGTAVKAVSSCPQGACLVWVACNGGMRQNSGRIIRSSMLEGSMGCRLGYPAPNSGGQERLIMGALPDHRWGGWRSRHRKAYAKALRPLPIPVATPRERGPGEREQWQQSECESGLACEHFGGDCTCWVQRF